MFGRRAGAPRIPEACWIASQTHSLPVPLCYCCQGGGRSTDVISAPWERSRERLSIYFFFFYRKSERAFLSVAGRDEISRLLQREFDCSESKLDVMFE